MIVKCISESVGAPLVEELVGQLSRRRAGVFEHAVGVVPDFVVKGQPAKQHPAAGGSVVVKAGGLDVLAGGQIELSSQRTRVLNAQPIKDAMIGRASTPGCEFEYVTVFLA